MNGHIVPRRSLRRLKPEEVNGNPGEASKRQEFDNAIKAKLGDSIKDPRVELKPEEVWPYNDDEGDVTYVTVDEHGHQYHVLDSIINFATDGNAVAKGDEYTVTRRGQKRVRKTTAGWKVLVQWKSGLEEWIPLKVLKESNPVEVAEFAKATGLVDEPAFK